MASQLARTAQPWALKNLPPFRPVAAKLLRLTAQDDVPLDRIQAVLRTDAAFSAEVLRLANSALIGSRNEVDSIAHAVGLLGLERLKALSMTIAMREFLGIPNSSAAMQLGWQLADMLGYSPFEIRSAATIEETTAALPAVARQRIFSHLDEVAGIVTQKLAAAESLNS